MKTLKKSALLLSSAVLSLTSVTTQAQVAVERPPQYVVITYDGSKSNNMWSLVRGVSKEMNAGISVYMSGLHFVTHNKLKTLYTPPASRKEKGFTNINTIPEVDAHKIPLRLQNVHESMNERFDIGSHAIGHFDGTKWSFQDWLTELTQFNDIIFNMYKYNNLVEPADYRARLKKNLKGFRAPLLARSDATDKALLQLGYTYDASIVAEMNKWAYKKPNGLWIIPMAYIPVVGTAKKTISMDYNFFAVDSKAVEDKANARKYEKRWYDSLMNYFHNNYYGNRAPVHIGGHFDSWNDDAYFNGLLNFARTVCNQPEVKCVTGIELLEILKKTPAATLAAYEKKQFKALARPTTLPTPKFYNVAVNWSVKSDAIALNLKGEDSHNLSAQGAEVNVSVNGRNYKLDNLNAVIDSSALNQGENTIQVTVTGADGTELLSSTRRLEVDSSASLQAIDQQDIEHRALQGDLPEAHEGMAD